MTKDLTMHAYAVIAKHRNACIDFYYSPLAAKVSNIMRYGACEAVNACGDAEAALMSCDYAKLDHALFVAVWKIDGVQRDGALAIGDTITLLKALRKEISTQRTLKVEDNA
jgi:hypothetical protein